MKISTRKDIAAQPADVFAKLTDFPAHEAQARGADVDVSRLDDGSAPARAAWRVAFDYRGRRRRADMAVVTYDPDQQLAIRGAMDGLMALGNVELMDLGDKGTRVFASVDLKPSTMTARILIQSLKLARGALERRLSRRLDRLAVKVERKPAANR